MRTFNDNAGRIWTIAINMAAIKRVRGLLNVDLYNIVDDGFKPLDALVGDPVMVADVLYCLCKDEADAKKIGDEDFGRALVGDAITLATDAFLEELIDLFSEAKARSSPRKIVAENRKVRHRLMAQAEKVLEAFDADRKANKLLRSFGIAPESSESTQVPSPSEICLMAKVLSRERWAHTSALLALTANVPRDHRKIPAPYRPADFNPHQRGPIVSFPCNGFTSKPHQALDILYFRCSIRLWKFDPKPLRSLDGLKAKFASCCCALRAKATTNT
jgi:hypothetical protein